MEIKLFLNIIKFFNLAILFAKLLRLRINETLLYFYTYVEEIMIETRLEIDLEISADVHISQMYKTYYVVFGKIYVVNEFIIL